MSSVRNFSLDDNDAYLITRLSTALEKVLDGAVKIHDVTYIQAAVLIGLHASNVENQAELAKLLGIDPSAITRLLDRLEDKKLVQRYQERDRNRDRRENRIELTQLGSGKAPLLESLLKEQSEKFFSELSDSQREGFSSTLREVWESSRG